jgi:hypothetical protein
MKHSKLDDIVDRNRTAGVTDWLFAVVLLAMVTFMIAGLRTSIIDGAGDDPPAGWAETRPEPRKQLEAAVAPVPLLPGS